MHTNPREAFLQACARAAASGDLELARVASGAMTRLLGAEGVRLALVKGRGA